MVIEGSGVWLELQDARKPDPEAKLEQAERDAARVNGLPIVVWHRIRERKIHASMRLSTLLKLSGVDTVWPSTGPIVHVSFGWVLERLAAMEAA
ncbi:MAG TPA: hypothetical protein VEA41_05800 [Salinarimonas sp.]|nr:hypothetical protein [Salinarimonas sp.]